MAATERTDGGDEPTGPLTGLRVIELGTLNALPAAGAMLGDLGAEVVKVEPPEGEPFRAMFASAGAPTAWTLVGRNKHMVSLALDSPHGVEILRRLTAVADVILLNQPDRVLERWDCTYASIAARNPRAVVAHVTGWGSDGPYAADGGNGTVSESFSGLTGVLAGDGDPYLTGALVGDHLTAVSVVMGVMAACYARDVNGAPGQLVDVAMYESVLPMMGPQIVTWNPDESTTSPAPRGNLRGTYRSSDGRWVAIGGASGGQVPRLLEALGVSDPGSTDVNHFAATWIGANDLDTVLETFRDARVPIAPVNDIASIVADPHVQHRGALTVLEDPELGAVRYPTPVPRLSATPAMVRMTPGALGADNEMVLKRWLDMTTDDIERLRLDGVLHAQT